MEVITLRMSKDIRENRTEIVERYVLENMLGEENTAAIIAGLEKEKGKDKVFQVLVLKNIKKPLQWDNGMIYRHPVVKGEEKRILEYFSKFPCVFVCQ